MSVPFPSHLRHLSPLPLGLHPFIKILLQMACRTILSILIWTILGGLSSAQTSYLITNGDRLMRTQPYPCVFRLIQPIKPSKDPAWIYVSLKLDSTWASVCNKEGLGDAIVSKCGALSLPVFARYGPLNRHNACRFRFGVEDDREDIDRFTRKNISPLWECVVDALSCFEELGPPTTCGMFFPFHHSCIFAQVSAHSLSSSSCKVRDRKVAAKRLSFRRCDASFPVESPSGLWVCNSGGPKPSGADEAIA